MIQDNLPKWDEQARPFYEVWFLKLNHRASGNAFWVRYTTLSPRFRAEPARGELWAIAFDHAGQHHAGKRLFPMRDVGHGTDPLIRLGSAELGDGRARGAVDAAGVPLSWDVTYTPNTTTFHHVPSLLRSRGILSTEVCSPNQDLEVKGWFQIGEQRFECDSEPGSQGHIWGTKYGHRWSWAHCNDFVGAPGTIFEGVTAQLALGGFVTPHLTSLFVRWKGEDHVMNGLVQLLLTPSEHKLGRWKFSADVGYRQFVGEVTAAPKDVVAVGYADTDGTMVYCHNSKIGSMTLEVQELDQGRWRTVDRVHSTGRTALEFTDRNQPPANVVRAH